MRPSQPAPPSGKPVALIDDLEAAGEHQRDQREVQALQAQCRQPGQHAQHGPLPARQQTTQASNGQRQAMATRSATQPPTPSNAYWHRLTQAELAVQQRHARGRDRESE